MLWRPNPGPQTRFLASAANEVLYGGAAGGGKSAAAIALPLRFIGNPRFNALVLRRDTPQLDDLISKSLLLYPKLGAKLNQTTGRWTFPSGARVWFTHCQYETDVSRFDGHEFQLIVFDELTHFTERQYTQIRARIRGADPTLPRWTRATTNPGGPGHEWVFKRFGAWLNPESSDVAAPGEVRYFVGDQAAQRCDTDALSRTFIPARLEDNPHVTGEYRAQLTDLDSVRKAQLLDGNWLIKPSAKDYWDRSHIVYLDVPPSADAIVRRVRAWDFGATTDGDYTAGVLMSLLRSGAVVIEHVVRFKGTPAKVRETFARTAAGDSASHPGTQQVIPQDPGQAGVDQVASYHREFSWIPLKSRRPSGDKATRFMPLSARALSGNIQMVRGEWNAAFHSELEEFPAGAYDDQVDAASDAYAECSTPPQVAHESSYDF